VDNSFTVSACPCGQLTGSSAARIGRLTSNVSPHARQRKSYLGIRPRYDRATAADPPDAVARRR
jgi:hypothetical protein